ncbi:MAG TPA: hypothetical protein VKZ85_14315 [Woeseiaceae bacterium]|nr:hypothetical protein [Woeseiaceae bacterium]
MHEIDLDLVREGVGLVRRLADGHGQVARDLERSTDELLSAEERAQRVDEARRAADVLAAVADAAEAYARAMAAVSGSGGVAMAVVQSAGSGKTFALPRERDR